jgi:hypothetical protein
MGSVSQEQKGRDFNISGNENVNLNILLYFFNVMVFKWMFQINLILFRLLKTSSDVLTMSNEDKRGFFLLLESIEFEVHN